jgi:hypothetical protein
MPSLRKDGVTLFYREANGEGAQIVLVHGCCDTPISNPNSIISRRFLGVALPANVPTA